MKKIILLNGILLVTSLGLTACDQPVHTNVNRGGGGNISVGVNEMNTSNAVSNANAINAAKDADAVDPKGFLTEAAHGGIAEVKMGELAASKAENAEVKQFAQKMVADHTKANAELKKLAEGEGVTLPTDMNAEQKATYDRLAKLSGAEFDREYMMTQVAAHEKTVDLFQKQVDQGEDAEVKAFANKTLPNLKMHLESARQISDKMK